ncbi:MAG TPA: protein kinase [Sandaracinaceae bacterium LLY-WYZ-13_1]|nr:protein kinase [Sandaracinaceae bacterium LLY-WYZ-13_1]
MDPELAATVPHGGRRGPVNEPALPTAGDRFGPYRIEATLARGGMGTVFRARDLNLDRAVALKLIHPGLFHRQDIRQMFHDEARSMASLSHPHVVPIYALGYHDEVPFIAMEYFAGGTLEERLEDGPLSLDEALPILRAVAEGLGAIHASGRVHGDVKPANVLFSRDGERIALTDMGLSFELGADDGTLRGTPAYMAPERAAEQPTPRRLQSRVDVYGLAVLAFEVLTGRLPFEAETTDALIAMHAHDAPPRASEVCWDVEPAVDEPLLRALGKDPRQRTATCAELVEQLEEAAVDAAVEPSTPPRLLVADDDPDWRQLLVRVLEKRFVGATVEEASDGKSAIAVALAEPPDLALIDLNMPGFDGVELTAALRELAPAERLPIVVLSGEGGARDWHALRDAGADRFFVKPCPFDELCDVVERLLDR